jgi:hypothetical protein
MRDFGSFIDIELKTGSSRKNFIILENLKLLKGAPWDGGLFSERQNWKTLGWSAVQGTGASLTS